MLDENVANEVNSDDADLVGDPTFVRRLAKGTVLVIILAGPTLAVLSVASQVFLSPADTPWSVLAIPIMSAGAVLLVIFGLWYVLAAALAHTSIMGVLAHKGADSPLIAVGLGCAIALAMPLGAIFIGAITGDTHVGETPSKLEGLSAWPHFAVTGALMGWLNWWVAVRPRQLSRPGDSVEAAPIMPSVLRAFVGITITSLAAGPLVAVFTFGDHIVGGSPAAAPLIIGGAAFVGIFLSLPAAVTNAILLSLLARFGVDALRVSVLCGGMIGLAVAIFLSTLGDERHAAVAAAKVGTSQPAAFLVYAVTGALMGALYWLIAIRPKQRRRLILEAAALRELAQTVQDAIERKQVRRVPWDGRVPPD